MTGYRLMQTCIKNNWFTHGTTEQYEKMFRFNNDGIIKLCVSDWCLNSIARMIWLCSDDSIAYDEIVDKLLKEEQKELKELAEG